MDRNEAYKLIQSHNIHPNFGYGGVSDEFLITKANILKDLADPEYFAPIWQVIECNCGGYNGELDDLLFAVLYDLKHEKEGIFQNDKKHQNYVELVNYILCSADICEYGTSPRFCWLTQYGEKVLELYEKQAEMFENDSYYKDEIKQFRKAPRYTIKP